ncbi:MAG TPA: hypothetical protein VH309_03070 [Elusimicrobiota bacterium]|jgi:hypothetical protein|nr:hypothetical protein [Elusimicrobiota bacterium]
MGVNLSPLSARGYTVGAAEDPYKKYWWAILGGFALTGLWLCVPVMETSVGSVHVDTAKPSADAAGAEQNLDSADNPAGAPGGALDLSMDGAVHKSKGGNDDLTSMLYQAPPETGAAAAGKPLGDATAASAASLAQQLKDAGKKTDASGWGEKAQRGFDGPHLAGGGLPGAGSLGGGGSSASAGGSVGAFGTRSADVGMTSTRGLQDDGQPESAGFKALKASAGAAAAPNLRGSDEAMHAGMSQAFDGAKGKAVAQVGTGAMAQANGALSAAPANLKLKPNDPKLDVKNLPDPPAAPTPASTSQNMGQQLAMMAATVLIGGLIPGVGGQMAMMMGMMMMQQQQQQAAAASAAKSSAATNQRLGT